MCSTLNSLNNSCVHAFCVLPLLYSLIFQLCTCILCPPIAVFPHLSAVYMHFVSSHCCMRFNQCQILSHTCQFKCTCMHVSMFSFDVPIGANCPGTSGTVPDLELLSRVPHGTCFLSEMSRKFYSTKLSNNYNLPFTFLCRLATLKFIPTRSALPSWLFTLNS